MTQPTPITADSLVVRRIIHAPREKVFAGWTDPEGMTQWFCPRQGYTVRAEIDFRVGGRFSILMHGAHEGNKERDYPHTGEYKVIQPPSKLVFTWHSDATDHLPTLVTVELFEHGKDTELVLTHEQFPKVEVVSDHARGWTEIVDRLAGYIESR